MAPSGEGSVLAFAIVAPLGLVGLPLAGLLVTARPATRRARLTAALVGGASVALLLTPEVGLLDGLTRAWIVLVSAAFAGGAALGAARFWPLAVRACLSAAAGVGVLGYALVGPGLWSELTWDAARVASGLARPVVEVAPGAYPLFEPAVRLLASGWAAWLALATLAGLALAWRGHARIVRRSPAPWRAAPRATWSPAAPPGGAPGGAVVNP